MVTWSAEGASQDDLMLKDECFLVNYIDDVVGHENKYNSHKFVIGQPKALVHRAFSVLLFDAQGRTLLQQRATSKITFSDVWTNTCCSHPLFGMEPSEYDAPETTLKGDPQGVKNAAVRKLDHELGIKSLDASRFTFVTRVHYWACDLDTHGPKSPWGEHEIDYVLVCKLREGEPISVNPHPDEVRDFAWVNQAELEASMADPTKKWSPWFKIIARRFLCAAWWTDLDALCAGTKFGDYSTIHRFDCHPAGVPVGAGGAVPGFLDELERSGGDPLEEQRRQLLEDINSTTAALSAPGKMSTKKQGAYGKVAIHEPSLAVQLVKPREVAAALKLKLLSYSETNTLRTDVDEQFCDDMLGAVSRSFAAVIRQLPSAICMDICVFYLVLRGLDTIEDDMKAFDGKKSARESALRDFHCTHLNNPHCSIDGVGEGDERKLLQNFGAVVRVFRKLPIESRTVIADVARDMGAGMAQSASANLAQGTADIAEYNRYCHDVAGLVGEGLTRIFVARGMESEELAGGGECTWPFCADGNKLGLANSMGLFLQKTNIIRDYLEDYVDGRAFWPQSVWRAYSNCDDLGEFSRPTARGGGQDEPYLFSSKLVDSCLSKGASSRALACLDHLVADALELVPDVLDYLAKCKTPQIYAFCAIPQVMAIATLAEVFDNPRLFTGVVKIRKGTTARIILDAKKGHLYTLAWFHAYTENIASKIDQCRANDSTKLRLKAICTKILGLTSAAASKVKAQRHRSATTIGLVGVALVAAAMFRLSR